MSAKKTRTTRKSSFRRAANRGFRAAGIGYQRAGTRRSGNCWKRLNRRANRQRDVYQVRAAHRAREICGSFLHGAALQRYSQRFRAVESYN